MAHASRREFLTGISALVTTTLVAGAGEPIFDLHQHTNYIGRSDEQLLAHQRRFQIQTTVLLPGEGWMLRIVGGNRSCADFESRQPGFVRFTCSDPAESRAIDVLRGNIRRGAVGIGEMKFHVAVDSPEMHRVYKLAEEMRVPVLLHFEHEMYNTGIERFEKILKAYPRVQFIGHAQTWWGNISADLNPLVMYPPGRVKAGGLTDRLLSDYPNLYGDLSAGSGLNSLTRDPEFATGFLQRHSRRLIWGSDCNCHDGRGASVTSGSCLAEKSLAALAELVPDRAVRQRILFENGAELLKSRGQGSGVRG
ncbi:MAG: amidohydrolase family protein [Acidobacteriota bacterium]